MPTPTYDLIASTVLSSSAASINFSSISSSYRDLVLVCDNPSSSNLGLEVRVNGNTGANYNGVRMWGDGGSFDSDTSLAATRFDSLYLNRFTQNSTFFLHLMDYAVTDKHKSMLYGLNTASSQVIRGALRWASTSAINEINLIAFDSNNYPAGFTAYLYGIVS